MRCAPRSKLDKSQGHIVHDSHAEILAIRAFNRVLLLDCAKVVEEYGTDEKACRLDSLVEYIGTSKPNRGDDGVPFRFRNDLKIFQYSSEAPCGDSSMELIMASQQDASPWTEQQPGQHEQPRMHGRGYFADLGIVRRKPGRSDAPMTLTKSCSDKLALKQCTGLLSSVASLLIDWQSVVLDALIVPKSQYSEKAFERAFGRHGRMQPVADDVQFVYRPFEVMTTNLEFAYSRRSQGAIQAFSLVAYNQAIVSWSSGQEVLINDVLRGQRQTDLRIVSSVSRKSLCRLVIEIAKECKMDHIHQLLAGKSYRSIKDSTTLAQRRRVKASVTVLALQGWQPNTGDDQWIVDA